MNDKKKLDLTDIEIGLKDYFVAHPIRAIMAAPFELWGMKIVLWMFFEPFTLENVMLVLFKLAIISFVSWLAYGPINYHNLKKTKQMEKMAEFMVNNKWQETTVKNENEHKYCAFCGKQLDIEWKVCPYCGKREEKIVSWSAYEPINYHNLKKTKQMEKKAEYIVNNKWQETTVKNENEHKYCAFCGKQLDMEWKICPYCGKREEKKD